MISCNLSRNIAVKTDGTLWVWGMNSPALGVATMGSDTPYITVPTQVGTETDWKSAVAGFGHFLAIKNDNSLWAWGAGDNGQLGNGSNSSIFLPTQIGTFMDWQAVEADSQSSFGIKTDGTLWAWGRNLRGNLGDGAQINILLPTQITANTDWKEITTSFFFTAAVKTDGSLYTWGSNAFGTLGDGTFEDHYTPQLINSCSLGTEDFGKNATISMYPNPVQSDLFIDTQETQQYQIYSILGVKISEGTLAIGNNIDCSNLTSGVYLLNLVDGLGNTSTHKFVKQ